MSWLTNREDAAKHPRERLGFMLLLGLVLGGAIGYLFSGGSPTWTVAIGVAFGALLAALEWKTLRDPRWAARRKRRPPLRKALVRLAMPFAVLAVAFGVGAATHSDSVFAVAVVLGLVVMIALRFTALR